MRFPTDEELDILKKWHKKDPVDLILFLNGLWFLPGGTIKLEEKPKHYLLHLNTMCWKGNEMLINALMDNVIFWNRHWLKSELGGHYTFIFDKSKID